MPGLMPAGQHLALPVVQAILQIYLRVNRQIRLTVHRQIRLRVNRQIRLSVNSKSNLPGTRVHRRRRRA